MLFVYSIEGHPVYAPKVRHIYQRMQERGDTLSTSTLTFGETLTGPLKGGDSKLADQMRQMFRSEEVELLPFLASTAEIYASIRARATASAPDAIHLATAAENNTDIFLTNDKRLHRLTIPGIHFIAGLDGVIF
jgi:predicted nucleic acid-binding protein